MDNILKTALGVALGCVIYKALGLAATGGMILYGMMFGGH